MNMQKKIKGFLFERRNQDGVYFAGKVVIGRVLHKVHVLPNANKMTAHDPDMILLISTVDTEPMTRVGRYETKGVDK